MSDNSLHAVLHVGLSVSRHFDDLDSKRLNEFVRPVLHFLADQKLAKGEEQSVRLADSVGEYGQSESEGKRNGCR